MWRHSLSLDLVFCTAKCDSERAGPSWAVSAARKMCMLVSNHGAEVQERDGLRITMETKAQHRRAGDSVLLSKIPSTM